MLRPLEILSRANGLKRLVPQAGFKVTVGHSLCWLLKLPYTFDLCVVMCSHSSQAPLKESATSCHLSHKYRDYSALLSMRHHFWCLTSSGLLPEREGARMDDCARPSLEFEYLRGVNFRFSCNVTVA